MGICEQTVQSEQESRVDVSGGDVDVEVEVEVGMK